MPKTDLYRRVDEAIRQGKIWRAKEILQGNIANREYDRELFERYGQLLRSQGDLIEAGKYLFLCAKRKPEYEEAIGLYLRRFAWKCSEILLSTFPAAARLEKIKEYPEAVREKLVELGVGEPVFDKQTHYPCQKRGWLDKARNTGCIIIFIFVVLCIVVGFARIIVWLIEFFS